MKSKTNFKQMYLVDASAYNRINNTTSTPIILGKPNIQISPPNLNVSAPVTTEIPIPSTYPSTQSKTSVGTQSNVLHTKSMGSMTESSPTKEHQASQTPQLPQQSIIMNKDEEVNDRNLRINNRSARSKDRVSQNNYRTLRNTPYTFHHPSSTETRQYIAPDNNFLKEMMDFSTTQNATPSMQSESQMMDYTSKIPIQYSPPTTEEMVNAKPYEIEAARRLNGVARGNNAEYNPHIHEQKPIVQQPTQQMHFESASNLPIRYNNPNTQLRNYNENSLNRDSDIVSLQHPQLMNYANTYSTLVEPQPMDIGNENSFKALPPPAPASKALPSPTPPSDCEECSVTPYKKYDVSLPFVTGLPENVIFSCTICQTNFGTKKKLQRHMKNIHDAFNQVEKGIKRKSKQDKTSPKKIKTTREVVPYSLYN